jgi:hypothetical protein
VLEKCQQGGKQQTTIEVSWKGGGW